MSGQERGSLEADDVTRDAVLVAHSMVDVPDVVTAGTPFELRVVNTGAPTGVGCVVEHASTRAPVAHPEVCRQDGMLVARATIRAPGVYRVLVKRGGGSAVADLVMAIPPEGSA